jgi:hypothetical protein
VKTELKWSAITAVAAVVALIWGLVADRKAGRAAGRGSPTASQQPRMTLFDPPVHAGTYGPICFCEAAPWANCPQHLGGKGVTPNE